MTTNDHDAARRKTNMRCLLYIVTGVIAQTAIIVLFVMLVMRIRNSKVRLRADTVESLTTNTSSFPSFNMKLNAQVTAKNTNFGRFKFKNSTATFTYWGTSVGEATIVKACLVKKPNVTVTTSSTKVSRNSQLSSDIKSGIIYHWVAMPSWRGRLYCSRFSRKRNLLKWVAQWRLIRPQKRFMNLKCKWSNADYICRFYFNFCVFCFNCFLFYAMFG